MATTSNLVSIKSVIAYAHDELKNRRALSVKDFEENGLTAQAHSQWTAYVDELKEAVDNYNDVTQAKDIVKAFKAVRPDVKGNITEKKAIDTIEGAVISTWRSVLKEGTENEFNKNFFLRDSDIAMLAGFCGLGTTNTAKGPQFSHKSSADFRKRIEMCIGIRMTGNGMLSDTTRDLIVAYESAVKTIDTNKAALADSKDNDGRTVTGLESSLKLRTIELEEQAKMLDELGIDADKKTVILKGLQAKVDELTTKVSEAKEKIEEAQKVVDNNKESYEKAIALLKSVGDYQ